MNADAELEHAYAEILSAVSHDLRNPLGTISIAATALASAAGADAGDPRVAKLTSIAERVQRQTDRLAHIIDSLADFAALRGGRFTVVPMPYPADAVLAAATAAVTAVVEERGLPVTSRAAADVPAFTCDLARVRQLMAALASIPTRVAAKTTVVAIGTHLEGTRPALTFESALPALPDAALPLLLADRWRSPASAYKSAGLPLALARGIAAAHGGAIRIERTEADRARFVITFGA